MYMLKSKEGGDAGTGKLYLGTTKFTSCVSHFFLSFALYGPPNIGRRTLFSGSGVHMYVPVRMGFESVEP